MINFARIFSSALFAAKCGAELPGSSGKNGEEGKRTKKGDEGEMFLESFCLQNDLYWKQLAHLGICFETLCY